MEMKERTDNNSERKGGVKIKIFGKNTCDACKATKDKFNFFLNHWNLLDKVTIEYYDLDTLEGLTEASFTGALDFPTTILENDGQELARWKKTVPTSQEFKQYFE